MTGGGGGDRSVSEVRATQQMQISDFLAGPIARRSVALCGSIRLDN
jgi:hypothetical protein